MDISGLSTDTLKINRTLGLIILLGVIELTEAATFVAPPPGGDTLNVSEDRTGGIYPLDVNDPPGNSPIFSILSQTPSTPAFTINSDDELTVPSQGLDAETTTEFIFRFSVKAGNKTATSGPLTLIVTDINDNDPIFHNTPYTGEVWKNDHAGTVITTVYATDPDISNLAITYTISGSQTTFVVNNPSGVITVSNTVGLALLSNPTVLQIRASDGGRTSTAAVIITVYDNPCSSAPCQNGGTCHPEKNIYTCTCLTGYIGDRCQSVDYCYQGPCKNNGTCNSLSTTYNCTCKYPFTGGNCTETDFCSPSPCRNGGTCINTVDGYKCNCTEPYSGEDCTKDLPPTSYAASTRDVHLVIVGVVAGVCLACIALETAVLAYQQKSKH